MDMQKLAILTQEYSGDWGLRHAERLITLVETIGSGMYYNKEVIQLAAYLHDWGGYPKWAVDGVDHWTRSREVAEEYLAEHNYPKDAAQLVLECIEYHHGGPEERSLESVLFTDADALDLLGIVGAARIFAMWPRDLRGGYNSVIRYRNLGSRIIQTEKARELAKVRIAETDEFIKVFGQEAFGCF